MCQGLVLLAGSLRRVGCAKDPPRVCKWLRKAYLLCQMIRFRKPLVRGRTKAPSLMFCDRA